MPQLPQYDEGDDKAEVPKRKDFLHLLPSRLVIQICQQGKTIQQIGWLTCHVLVPVGALLWRLL